MYITENLSKILKKSECVSSLHICFAVNSKLCLLCSKLYRDIQLGIFRLSDIFQALSAMQIIYYVKRIRFAK